MAEAKQLVVLEPLREQHVQAYLDAFSPEVAKQLHVSSLDTERAYLQEQLAKHHFFYVIIDWATNAVIGAVEIRESHAYRGQLYCWLNEAYWSTGRFQQAVTQAAHNYFAETDAMHFTARVDVTNKRSYHALKKAGFSDVGIVDGPWGKQYELIFRKQ